MSDTITWKVAYNHWPDLRDQLRQEIAKSVGTIAQQVAKVMAQGAPVDTGAEAAGFYVLAEGIDGYSEAVSRAQSANKEVHILEHAPNPPNPMTAYISHVPEHTIYQELGTTHMAPQPTMIPAMTEAESHFLDDLADAINAVIDGLR